VSRQNIADNRPPINPTSPNFLQKTSNRRPKITAASMATSNTVEVGAEELAVGFRAQSAELEGRRFPPCHFQVKSTGNQSIEFANRQRHRQLVPSFGRRGTGGQSNNAVGF
jgi:hypothetical protein